MTGPDPINIFDGHNDLAYQLSGGAGIQKAQPF